MPKRRNYEEDYVYLQHKMKKLKRKMERVSRRSSSDEEVENEKPASPIKEDVVISANDWIIEPELEQGVEPVASPVPSGPHQDPDPVPPLVTTEMEKEQHQEVVVIETPNVAEQAPADELDKEILEILGEAPPPAEKYGPAIREELACRLQHIATEGMGKEVRKEISNKYPIPANCLHVNAPGMNPEMKAAIPEPVSKRDKAIEQKQRQLGSAIACLSGCLDTLLKAKEKDSDIIAKVMDATRLLCDIQHTDSLTRRHFILSSLKKEVKEQLSLTKVDSMLFSTSLAETLKSAKAVSKSGTELKADYLNSNKQAATSSRKDSASSSKPFLRRPAPVVTRRPMGPAFREQTAFRGHPHRPQQGRSSRPSSYRPQAPPHRRH